MSPLSRFLLSALIILAPNLAHTQLSDYNFGLKRKLRVIQESKDSTVIKLKRDQLGKIKALKQEFYDYSSEDVIVYFEDYKKDKWWTISRSKEVLLKDSNGIQTYKSVLDGNQYSFNEDGTIIFLHRFKNNEQIGHSIEISYYPNGNIKFVAEYEKYEFINILTFNYPNGETYDYGDFKNGSGTITWLNDEGEPCLSCRHEFKKKPKKLSDCDDNGTN